jgi:hypothetical protein
MVEKDDGKVWERPSQHLRRLVMEDPNEQNSSSRRITPAAAGRL